MRFRVIYKSYFGATQQFEVQCTYAAIRELVRTRDNAHAAQTPIHKNAEPTGAEQG